MDKFQTFMNEYNLPTMYTGFAFARESLAMVSADVTISNKYLFLTLAKKFNTSTNSIERNLRTFVEKSWRLLPQLFTKRPTIREFLTKCAIYAETVTRRPKSAYDILETF